MKNIADDLNKYVRVIGALRKEIQDISSDDDVVQKHIAALNTLNALIYCITTLLKSQRVRSSVQITIGQHSTFDVVNDDDSKNKLDDLLLITDVIETKLDNLTSGFNDDLSRLSFYQSFSWWLAIIFVGLGFASVFSMLGGNGYSTDIVLCIVATAAMILGSSFIWINGVVLKNLVNNTQASIDSLNSIKYYTADASLTADTTTAPSYYTEMQQILFKRPSDNHPSLSTVIHLRAAPISSNVV